MAPVEPALIETPPIVSYSTYGTYGTDEPGGLRSQKFAVGCVYNFSKRTAAYATYAHLRNSGGHPARSRVP